jgi:tetratricopeptide (TPR) repeat protein
MRTNGMALSTLQSVQGLFDEALTLPTEERPAFLDRACSGKPALRGELEALLRFDGLAESAGFLAEGLSRPTLTEGGRDLIGTRVGPYQIIEPVGRGGMGTVYRAARVEDYSQEVAIKVAGVGSADEFLARFLSERQLLSGLTHPNIARLLDGGVTPDGRPYFVMELVRGERIDRYAEREGLGIKDRVTLLLQACAAARHAHECGVIHRDLKSANVLVTEGGDVRVVDFGLARRAGGECEQALTATGAFLGTPGYAAPEQVTGDPKAVGPTTDVYGLGAVLYELLTGRPPFRAESVWETLRQVREVDPLPPSRLTAGLHRDLETVCMKCLLKDPGKRYPGVRELSEDLGRFLRGEPVLARRPGPVRRLASAFRRRPLVVGLSSALTVAVLAGLVTATALWRVSESRRKLADQRLGVALAGLELHTDAARERLSVPYPLTPAERAALLKALDAYESLLLETGGEPKTREAAARGYEKVARVFYDMGEHGRALTLYGRAVELFSLLKAEFPKEPEYQLQLSRCHLQEANCLSNLGRDAEKLMPAREAVLEAEDLVARYPEEDRYRGALACHEAALAWCLMEGGKDGEAESLLRHAVGLEEELLSRHPEDPQRHVRLAGALNILAELALKRGDSEALIQSLRRRLRLADELAERFRDDPQVCAELLGHAEAADHLERLGRAEEAKEVFERGLALKRRQAARFPGVAFYREGLAKDITRVGLLTWGVDRDAGLAAFREAKALFEALIRDFPERAALRCEMGFFLAECPDPDVRDAPRALALARSLAADSPDDESGRRLLGIALYESGDWKGALDCLPALPDNEGRDAPLTSAAYRVMALWQLGDKARAREELATLKERVRSSPYAGLYGRYFTERAAKLIGP